MNEQQTGTSSSNKHSFLFLFAFPTQAKTPKIVSNEVFEKERERERKEEKKHQKPDILSTTHPHLTTGPQTHLPARQTRQKSRQAHDDAHAAPIRPSGEGGGNRDGSAEGMTTGRRQGLLPLPTCSHPEDGLIRLFL